MERRILIVDDEEPIRRMLTDAFSDEGYAVVSASCGRDALTVLKQDPVRVMFLDLMMPGMNGLELCRAIKDRYPISCVYAMTAYISLFGLSDCLAAGFEDYFNKPVEIAVLLRSAAQAFQKLERWTSREERG